MYAVVRFGEENTPAIVPSNWIDKKRNICFYPNIKTELQENELLLEREEPKSDWTECPIKLHKEFASYTTAKSLLSEAEFASNLESEEEGERKKRKRKYKKILHPREDESATSRSDVEYGCSCGKKRGLESRVVHLTPPLPPSQKVPPVLSYQSPSTSYEPTVVDFPQSSQSSSSSGCSSSDIAQTDLLQIRRRQEQMWKVLGELSQTYTRLETKMDAVLSILEAKANYQPKEECMSYVKEDLLSKLPTRAEEIDYLEDKIKAPAVKNELIKYLSAIDGKDVKALAANVMRRMFMDEIGEKYSLTGRSWKEGPNKRPFIKTESYQVVYEICLRRFSNAEESRIRESVSDWLMQAKFRKLRRENRKNLSLQHETPAQEDQ